MLFICLLEGFENRSTETVSRADSNDVGQYFVTAALITVYIKSITIKAF